MRLLVCLCLATGLLAGEPPRPGLDRAFLAGILEAAGDGSKPWKTFRVPEASVKREFLPTGLVCTIEFPVGARRNSAEQRP